MPLFPTAPVRILPYFGYRNARRLHVSARALRAEKPDFRGSGRWQAMRTMISQFASHEMSDVEVRLEIERQGGERSQIVRQTDKEGFVRFDVELDDEWALPDHTSWDVIGLHWRNERGEHSVDAHVLAPGSRSSLGVISDIDDTIIETGITGNLRSVARNWRRVLAQLPDERVAVPGADVFYSSLGGGRVLRREEAHTGERIPATHRPFFYVSSSPWNLFSYLVAFKRMRRMPLGPIFLRDWGLNRETFGSGSHGSHKTEAIDHIVRTYPERRFALIGDDTQGDLPAFGDVVRRHPERIAAVFIRTTAGAFSAEETAAKKAIEDSGVPLWLGDSYEIGQDFLVKAGVSAVGDTAKIVEAVEKGGKSVAGDANERSDKGGQ